MDERSLKNIPKHRQVLQYLKKMADKCNDKIELLDVQIPYYEKRGRTAYVAELKALREEQLDAYEEITLHIEKQITEALQRINEHLNELTPAEAFFFTKSYVEGLTVIQIQDECALNPEYSSLTYERSSIIRFINSAKAKLGIESGGKNE